MARNAELTIEWADGEYKFRLGMGEIKKLQERTNRGPYNIFDRIQSREFKVEEIIETIRLGLIGGGTCVTSTGMPDDARVRHLIKDYVEERPIIMSMFLAARILDAALAGVPDEPVPKSKAKGKRSPTSQTGSSPSPTSTVGDQSSDTVHATSTP